MGLFRSARLMFLALAVLLLPAVSNAGVFISVNFGPPVLPVYEQPPCPGDGLMWTPGYWAYGPDGYFWVPGAWVPAPFEGALWTPGYWGWSGGLYIWHPGYWGRHVGYYGGVNYGFGYLGIGFAGGEWRGGVFAYNTAAWHVNERVVHNTYVNETIIHNTTIVNDRHVAYSGGPGGIQHQPQPEERIAEREQHVAPTSYQSRHEVTAKTDRAAYFKNNQGRPQNVVVARPLAEEKRPAPAAAQVRQGNTPESRSTPMTARPGTQQQGTQPQERGIQGQDRTNPNALGGNNRTPSPETQPMQQTQPRQEMQPKQQPQPMQQTQPRQESRPQQQPQSKPQQEPKHQPQAKPQQEPKQQPKQQPEKDERKNEK